MEISRHEFTETITWRCSIEKVEPTNEHESSYQIRYETHDGSMTCGGYATYEMALDHASHYSTTESATLREYGASAKAIVRFPAYDYTNWPFTVFFACLPHAVLAMAIMRSVFIDNTTSIYLGLVGLLSMTLLGILALALAYYIYSILSNISYWKSELKEALKSFGLYGFSKWWRSLNLEVKWFVIISYLFSAMLLIDIVNGDVIIKFFVRPE